MVQNLFILRFTCVSASHFGYATHAFYAAAVYDMTGLLHCQWQMQGQTPMALSSLLPQWLLHGWTTNTLFLVELSREWMLYRYFRLTLLSRCLFSCCSYNNIYLYFVAHRGTRQDPFDILVCYMTQHWHHQPYLSMGFESSPFDKRELKQRVLDIVPKVMPCGNDAFNAEPYTCRVQIGHSPTVLALKIKLITIMNQLKYQYKNIPDYRTQPLNFFLYVFCLINLS